MIQQRGNCPGTASCDCVAMPITGLWDTEFLPGSGPMAAVPGWREPLLPYSACETPSKKMPDETLAPGVPRVPVVRVVPAAPAPDGPGPNGRDATARQVSRGGRYARG